MTSATITAGDLLRDTRDQLEQAGIENPGVDAELILAHVLRVSRGRVHALALLGTEVSPVDRDRVDALASERARRVPLQHLTGLAPFRGIELHVGPGVFVPRPETETVAQFAIDALQAVPDPEPLAVDLCTGSGAIALAIAAEVPTARVWAVEKSREAHAWAQRNVAELGDGRVSLLHGDIAELDGSGGVELGGRVDSGTDSELDADADAYAAIDYPDIDYPDIDYPDIDHPGIGADADAPAGSPLVAEFARLAGRVHVLVSNPPYVPDDMVPRDPEVRDHDPELALYGGVDGLDLVRVISRIGLRLVAPGGSIVLEHAETQGAAIRALLTRDGWRAAATHRDLTLRDRATTAIR